MRNMLHDRCVFGILLWLGCVLRLHGTPSSYDFDCPMAYQVSLVMMNSGFISKLLKCGRSRAVL